MLRIFIAFLLCVTSMASALENARALFSPTDHVAEELVNLIDREKKSVKAAVYCLTHRGIVKALTDAHKRGVPVEIIVDPFTVKAHAPVKRMSDAGVPIFVYSPPVVYRETKAGKKVKKKAPLMHDKFCILGDKRVWTGSFNFTTQAAHANSENVLILDDEKIAKAYLAEFDRLKSAHCTPLKNFLLQQE